MSVLRQARRQRHLRQDRGRDRHLHVRRHHRRLRRQPRQRAVHGALQVRPAHRPRRAADRLRLDLLDHDDREMPRHRRRRDRRVARLRQGALPGRRSSSATPSPSPTPSSRSIRSSAARAARSRSSTRRASWWAWRSTSWRGSRTRPERAPAAPQNCPATGAPSGLCSLSVWPCGAVPPGLWRCTLRVFRAIILRASPGYLRRASAIGSAAYDRGRFRQRHWQRDQR